MQPLRSGDVEMLARVLAVHGAPGRAHARALLEATGGLAGLARADAAEIAERLEASGAGRAAARARALAAAFELGRRAAVADATPPARIASSAEVAAWASPWLAQREHEELWLVALDGRSRLRAARCVGKGGLHGVAVRASDPLRLALRTAASGFVLVHNHPSGDPSPSAEDVAFTRRVAEGAVAIGVPLVDHVVVARGGFASVPGVSG